jgi:hypothetical protein
VSEWEVTVIVPGSTRLEALHIAEVAIRAMIRDDPTEIVVHVRFINEPPNTPPKGVISSR